MAGINPATGQFDPYYNGGGAYTGENKTAYMNGGFVNYNPNAIQLGMGTTYTGPAATSPTPTPDTPVVTGNGDTGGVTGGNGDTAVAPPPAFSAQQMLENLLRTALGIEGLGNWAADLYNRGASATEIVQALRYGTDTSEGGKAARAAYLKAFPQMDVFLKDGVFSGENPELQYIAYRNTVREAAARYGVDSSLMSNDAVAGYIGSRTSAAELADRMNTAATAIATTPTETYRQLQDYYGITGSDLMSFYLNTDVTEAELQKRYTAARIGTEAARQTFGIDRGYAEDLAQRGITLDQATRGFGQAFQQRGFMYGKGDTVGQGSLLEGQFGVAADAAAVDRVARARVGAFEGGGQYAGTQSGTLGIGSSAM